MVFFGIEFEFIVFDNIYCDVWVCKYEGFILVIDYNVDYNLFVFICFELLLCDICNSMDGVGLYCEGVKGECNFG